MSKATTSQVRGRQPRIGLRMLLASSCPFWGGVVVRRYAFLAVAAALHLLWWSLAIHHLLRVMAIATLLQVLHWNAAAILYGLFAVVAGAWPGVTYGRRLLGD